MGSTHLREKKISLVQPIYAIIKKVHFNPYSLFALNLPSSMFFNLISKLSNINDYVNF